MGTDEVEDLLRRLCSEASDRDTVHQAHVRLAALRSRSLSGLLAALEDTGLSTTGRIRVVDVLGSVRSEAALSALVAHLKDADSGVRWAAAHALGKSGNPTAIPFLEAIALRDPASFTPLPGLTLSVSDAARTSIENLRREPMKAPTGRSALLLALAAALCSLGAHLVWPPTPPRDLVWAMGLLGSAIGMGVHEAQASGPGGRWRLRWVAAGLAVVALGQMAQALYALLG